MPTTAPGTPYSAIDRLTKSSSPSSFPAGRAVVTVLVQPAQRTRPITRQVAKSRNAWGGAGDSIKENRVSLIEVLLFDSRMDARSRCRMAISEQTGSRPDDEGAIAGGPAIEEVSPASRAVSGLISDLSRSPRPPVAPPWSCAKVDLSSRAMVHPDSAPNSCTYSR